MNATLLYPAQCFLGEGPFWHAGRKSCFWVDIENRQLFEYPWQAPSEGAATVRQFDRRVSLILPDKQDRLLLGMQGGLAAFDPGTGDLQWLLDIEKDLSRHRCNDGGIDCEGRLWVGTLQLDFDEGAGSLYCIDQDKVLRKKLGSVTISNGMVWSLDNKRLYYIDSPRRTVQTFFFDSTTGNIQFEKVAVRIPADMGTPDGMTIDEEGMLWVAHWGGFGVYRWNPLTGELLDSVKLPVPNVSCCAFAGKELDHLIITTARQDLSEEELVRYPQSGDVFVAKMAVRGIAGNICKF
jgi:sugar lactone lactonase YvrE